MTQQPTDHDDSAADLTALMTRAVGELQPPVERLQHSAALEGRRIRRRRQGAGLLGGVAAATVLAVLIVPGVGGTSTDRDRFAADPTGAPSPAPTSAPTSDAEPVGFWSMPSTEMRDRLRSLLPDGAHLSHLELAPDDPAPGQSPVTEGWVRATVTRDGIAGESTIELMLWPPAPGEATGVESPGTDGTPTPTSAATGGPTGTATAATLDGSTHDLISCPGNLVAPTSCTELDGGVGRTADFVDGALTQHEVTIAAGSGFVFAAVANTTDDKWGPGSATSGEAPALTGAELLAIATAPAWTDWTP